MDLPPPAVDMYAAGFIEMKMDVVHAEGDLADGIADEALQREIVRDTVHVCESRLTIARSPVLDSGHSLFNHKSQVEARRF